MIDNFAIAVTHLLMGYIAVRLMLRADLDHEPSPDTPIDRPIDEGRE
ncbi:hypothetical protein ACXYN8_09840 [Altererythrobacter sp. CAU 1778]